MQNPVNIKNKAELIVKIQTAQKHFGEEPSVISPAINRAALETMLLSYVALYRETVATGTIEKAHRFDTIPCTACEETGIYEPNGGPCYRCTGKGYQLESDQKRNYGYDLHHTPVKWHDFEADAAKYAAEQAAKHVAGTVPNRVEDYDPDDIPF